MRASHQGQALELRAALRRAVLDEEDEEPYFHPLEGNVAFASAFDGWAFQLSHFAELSAPKLGCSAEDLRRWPPLCCCALSHQTHD